jgi:hypothetical protein
MILIILIILIMFVYLLINDKYEEEDHKYYDCYH